MSHREFNDVESVCVCVLGDFMAEKVVWQSKMFKCNSLYVWSFLLKGETWDMH